MACWGPFKQPDKAPYYWAQTDGVVCARLYDDGDDYDIGVVFRAFEGGLLPQTDLGPLSTGAPLAKRAPTTRL